MPANRNAAKVGTFLFMGLALIGFLLIYFSKGALSVIPHMRVYMTAEGVGGLNVGAKVLLSGVPIGTVERTELTDAGRRVKVTLRIIKRFPVPANAHFAVEQAGFLGDQFIAITVPKENAPPLDDGAVVSADQPFNLAEAARSAMGLMQKLGVAVDRINAAVERVDRVVLTDQTLTNVAETLGNLKSVSANANAGIADVRTFFATNGPAVSATLGNLNRLSTRLTGVATNLDETVEDLRPSLRVLATNLTSASDSLRSILAEVSNGHGLAGALLHDDAFRDKTGETLTNLATVSSNLARFGLLYKPKQPHVVITNAPEYPGRKF